MIKKLINFIAPQKKHHKTVWREEANTIDELLEVREMFENEQQKLHNRKKLEKLLKQDANRKKNQLQNTLTRMGRASTHTETDLNGKSRKKTNKVHFIGPALINSELYMFRVDVSRLPGQSARINRLNDEEILEDLGYSLGCEVTVFSSKSKGFWYVVSRKANMGAIPIKINYDEVLSLLPKRASRFTIAWGVTVGKKLIYSDLRKLPHGLIAGSTNAGKSVAFKNIILTLCKNSPPEKLRILIIDFKNAGDFSKFRTLGHLGTPDNLPIYTNNDQIIDIDFSGEFITEQQRDHCRRIITEPAELKPLLEWINEQVNKRNAKFGKLADEKNLDITNIIQYNNHFRRNPLDYYFIFIDELPIAMIEHPKKIKDTINKMLSAIVRKGRSAGFLIYIGAQSVNKASIGPGLMENMGAKMVGRTTSSQSILALGRGTASKIKLVAGRMAIKTDDSIEPIEIQTPWIPPKLAAKMIIDINRKWTATPDHDPVTLTLFKLCLNKFDKIFDPDVLFKQFPNNSDYSRAVCRAVGKEYQITPAHPLAPEDKAKGVEINKRLYFLLPAIAGKRPRKLITEIDLQKLLQHTTPNKPMKPPQESIVPPQESIVPPQESIVPPQDVFKWCLNNNNGYFSIRKTHEKFGKGSIKRRFFEKMGSNYENKEIEIDGQKYLIGESIRPKGRPISIVPPENDSRLPPPAVLNQESNTPIDNDFSYIPDATATKKGGKEKIKQIFPLAIAVDLKTKKSFEKLKQDKGIKNDHEAFEFLMKGEHN